MRKKQGAESFGVIGLGRFGTALAITIAKAGKDVIVIDRNEAKVKELRQYTDYAFVVDELNADSLREVGIQNCDTVIVCIGEKMDNAGIQRDPTLLIFQGAKNADSDSSSW